ncbi:hypothetical protein JCM10295v2_006859 [Rhodotorula toruloides]
MTTLARHTPRTTSKQSPRHVHILHDEPGDSRENDGLGWAEVQALVDDFELEAASYLRTLSNSRTTSLASLSRHFTDTLSSLDPRVCEMSLARFVREFASDPARALRGVVGEEMRVKEGQGSEASVLATARKRKRVLPLSPRQDGHDVEDDPENPFLSSNTSGAVKHKKLRQATSATDLKVQEKGKGKSVVGGGSVRNATAGEGGGTARKTRLRLRPSNIANPTSSSSANANFIYRTKPAYNPAVPPTPSTAHKSRQPRRGESIVLRSLNDSPLGEFVASSLSHSAAEEEEEEEDEEGEWDLVGEGEASRVERLTPSTSRLCSPTKKSSRSTKVRPPSTKDFSVPLPPNAPSFESLKAKWVEEVREKLRAQVESEDGGVGEEERRRLEEVLMGFLR